MVRLRLRRMGTIDKPFYRIVVIDSRKKRDGKYIESVGYYDPKTDPLTLKVDVDKIIAWLKVGAQPTQTVRSLFKKAGIMEKWHNIRFPKQKDVVSPENAESSKEDTKKGAETEQKMEEKELKDERTD
ncbi:MAG: 30S ribosomal protein S16 [Candidatus Cloacimonetes bacterium]|nr:30S ribosomal protein S16 [Candidatus Cloacimonadota bacterium]